MQVTQFEFALQYYSVKETQPKEIIQIDNTYSVDYIKEGILKIPLHYEIMCKRTNFDIKISGWRRSILKKELVLCIL